MSFDPVDLEGLVLLLPSILSYSLTLLLFLPPLLWGSLNPERRDFDGDILIEFVSWFSLNIV